jgi:UDP-glucose 4-epimerase
MKKILVTGGLGFIGSHTAVALMDAGYEPIIFDNLCNSRESALKGIAGITGRMPQFIKGDICNNQDLVQLFSAHQFHAVIHFAALKAVGESVEKPLLYYRNNIGGMLNLLQHMQENGVKQMVFSSSATVYGQSTEMPVHEESPIPPALSPYGSTKQMGEQILRDDPAFHTACLRYFNPIGAHPSGLIGELPLGVPNNLVPFVTQTAAGIRPSLTIFGDDYNTPDGTCTRDYLHVMDLAEAHVAALRFLEKRPVGSAHFEVFNLGTGQGHTVKEVVSQFEKVNGVPVKHTYGKRRTGDVEALWANPAKAEQLLGWKATRDLDTMLRDAWNWQQKLNQK